MNSIKLQILKTFYVFCFSIIATVGFSQNNIVITNLSVNPIAPTDCSNFDVTATGTLSTMSYQLLSKNYTVSGNTITVDFNFSDPFIVVPAFGSFNETVTASNVPAGNYTLIARTYRGSTLESMMSTNITITSCCSANADISTAATEFCLGDSATLIATNIVATAVQWEVNGVNFSTNTITGYNFSNVGTYNIVLTATLNGCSTTDMATITVDSIVGFDIGADTSFCAGNSVVLDATGSAASSYLWSTGETTGTITVDSTGTYSVKVTENACEETDIINVTVNAPEFNLGDDVQLCFGETVTFSDTIGMSNQYLWSTGATTSSVTVDTTTVLMVTVTDPDGCQSTDDVMVTVNPEIVIGLSDTATIDTSGLTLDAGMWSSYLWSTGDTTQTIDVSASGIYTVTVSDGSGCMAMDSINITVVSAKHLANIQTVKVFPNPAMDYLQIDATNIDLNNASMIIANSVGQVLKTINANNVSNINITDLSSGVYYLKILDKNSQAIGVAKFVKL